MFKSLTLTAAHTMTLAITALTISQNAFAEGSIAKDDVITQVCKESKPLCATLKVLNLADQGDAIRVGRQFANGGERVMPYTFSAGDFNNPILVLIDRDSSGQLTLTVSEQK